MRRLVIVATLAAVAGSLLPHGGVASWVPGPGRTVAAESSAPTVTLLIAARTGRNRDVAAGLASLGATVRYREDSIDYLRAVVPADQVENVARLDGVLAAAENTMLRGPDPDTMADPQNFEAPSPQPAPGLSTPADNPYLPIGDIGAAQFVAQHPEWDGRGVTIGVLDSGVALDHPALQTTTTGERKIIDWTTSTDPLATNQNRDPTWVPMTTVVTGPAFAVGGVSYTAPAAVEYRFGIFDERAPELGGELANDVNRDRNPAGSSGRFGVLWNADTNEVWVDVDQDGSFADEPAMTDYASRYDVRWFGTDNPATAIREQIPFVVQVDGKRKAVNIGIVSASHGTGVAVTAAGRGVLGGAMTGSAPGAQIVSVRSCLFVTGCPAYAHIEGLIYLAKQHDVDVINLSAGAPAAVNAGVEPLSLLVDRLVETYNVPVFAAAGNGGPGLNTVQWPAIASKAVSVGAYIGKETVQRLYGTTVARDDLQQPFSSDGPREDGGFKPDIVAPASVLTGNVMWQPAAPFAGTFAVPVGYRTTEGTSQAAPIAAGAAALLVSAAEATGAQHQPDQIREALRSSARLLEDFTAADQGAGLVDTAGAWEILRENIRTVRIEASVAVHTVLADQLPTPGIGSGIYDREGVTLGEAYTREVTFTRRTGGGATRTYTLSWTGNDGTFSLDPDRSTIDLPLDLPVTIGVRVDPMAVGEHAAILNLDDETTAGIDHQVMNTVVVPETFTASTTIIHTDTVGRLRDRSYYFLVPSGTETFSVSFAGPSEVPGTGQARFLRFDPRGIAVDPTGGTSCYIPSPSACEVTAPNTRYARTALDPMPGVWEVTVDARRTSDAIEVPFTLTVSISTSP
jgi:hypothetical protein